MQGYEPKQESKPVLYQPEEEEKKDVPGGPVELDEDAEKAEGKKSYDEQQAETPKKKYK